MRISLIVDVLSRLIGRNEGESGELEQTTPFHLKWRLFKWKWLLARSLRFPEIVSRIDSSGININAVTLIFLYRSDPLSINATKGTGPCEFRISNRPFQSFYLTKKKTKKKNPCIRWTKRMDIHAKLRVSRVMKMKVIDPI